MTSKKRMEPYENLGAELILRDQLAIDRTVLAAERTLLAYLRTTVTLLVAGFSSIHFMRAGVLVIGGWVMVAMGVVVSVWGVFRCLRIMGAVRAARRVKLQGDSRRDG